MVDGGELFDYLVDKGKLKEEEGLDFFQQIIFGIHYCHAHLIVHRDLKPENLLLNARKEVKIADFGMASLIRNQNLLATSCGSPHYASPEVIAGSKYDGMSSDMWSCGVVLYALMTGRLPFDDNHVRKLFSKIKKGVFEIPSYVNPSCADLIKRLLTVDPEKRATIEETINHPWFRSRNPRHTEFLDTNFIEAAVKWNVPSKKDKDVLRSMMSLGWEVDDLFEHLDSPEHNLEKVFYNLLTNWKNQTGENFFVNLRQQRELMEAANKKNGRSRSTSFTAASLSPQHIEEGKGVIEKIKQQHRVRSNSMEGVKTAAQLAHLSRGQSQKSQPTLNTPDMEGSPSPSGTSPAQTRYTASGKPIPARTFSTDSGSVAATAASMSLSAPRPDHLQSLSIESPATGPSSSPEPSPSSISSSQNATTSSRLAPLSSNPNPSGKTVGLRQSALTKGLRERASSGSSTSSSLLEPNYVSPALLGRRGVSGEQDAPHTPSDFPNSPQFSWFHGPDGQREAVSLAGGDADAQDDNHNTSAEVRVLQAEMKKMALSPIRGGASRENGTPPPSWEPSIPPINLSPRPGSEKST
jgi:serine/threonine-protein kinase HSL1, negative regulator of Swe1 kinase